MMVIKILIVWLLTGTAHTITLRTTVHKSVMVMAQQYEPTLRGNLILEFIKAYKKIKFTTLVYCSQSSFSEELISIDSVKLFMSANIAIKLFDICGMDGMDSELILKILNIKSTRQVIAVDLVSCNMICRQFLVQASEHGLFNSSYHWLLIEDFPSVFQADEFFDGLNININSEITLAKPQGFEKKKYNLYDIWHLGNTYGGSMKKSRIGHFTVPNGLNIDDKRMNIIRRNNLNNIRIRCMIVITSKVSEPFDQYLEHTYNPHLDSMNRFNFALLRHVRDMFNFSFQLHRTNSWGYLKNGSFDGMIGALVRHEVDIGGSPIFFRIERAKVIDYTSQTWISRPCFIFRHPTSHLANAFLRPFSGNCWMAILFCGIFATSVVYGVFRYERLHADIIITGENQIGFGDNKWSESIILFWGIVCQQGSIENPRFLSGRYLVLIILVFGFLIYQFYSASIVGSLLMEKPKSIKTLRDLIDSLLNIGIEDIIYNRDFFSRTNDSDALELLAKRIEINDKKTGKPIQNWLPAHHGLMKVKSEDYAFHVDVATAYKVITDTFTEQEICELTEVQLFPPQRAVTIVQKGSPLRKMITYGLKRVTEAGLLYRERTLWHSHSPKCVRRIKPEDLSVGIQSATSAIFIYLIGVTLSWFILLLEITYRKFGQFYLIK